MCLLLVGSTISLFSQDLPVLTPEIGDAPDFSGEARMIYEEGLKVVKRVESGEVNERQLNQRELNMYYSHTEMDGEFVDGFYGLGEFYVSGCPYKPAEIRASSSLKGSGSYSYDPTNLVDMTLETAWVEGIEGNGLGESMTYSFEISQESVNELWRLAIHNGYVKSTRAWRNNGRVKELKMSVNGVPLCILALEDMRNQQTFNLSSYTYQFPRNPEFTFEIRSVYPGDKYEDVAISQLNFGYRGCQCLGAETPIKMGDGSLMPIAEVETGMEVWGLNTLTGEMGPAKVEGIAVPTHDELFLVTLSDGSVLKITKDHPVYVTGKGWYAIAPDLAKGIYLSTENTVAPLTVGDIVQDGPFSLKVISIEKEEKVQATYTFIRLSGGYTAFMANGVWVGLESYLFGD